MKKVGIITLNGYFNYGNRLQNYALQETLKKHNCLVETIRIKGKQKNNTGLTISKKMWNVIKKPQLIAEKIKRLLYLNKLNKDRESRFRTFSDKYIKETPYLLTEVNLSQDYLDDFDYFVTGSDQVWNPYFTEGSSLYFLTFAPQYKRIAYSPSFGISRIPEQHALNYKKWLSNFNYLSVREEAGAKIIKELTNIAAPVLADPTLLLTKSEWMKIIQPAINKPKEKYILTYFLGEVPKDVKVLIMNKKKKHGLEVVNLANSKYKKYYLTNPSEFLDYIKDAELFITDSFHGSVFSIIFETPFIVVDRLGSLPSMNSRIDTLLTTFRLKDRHLSRVNKKGLFNVDYTHVNPILEKERMKSFEYLSRALSHPEKGK